jgi:hypothetical protein
VIASTYLIERATPGRYGLPTQRLAKVGGFGRPIVALAADFESYLTVAIAYSGQRVIG